MVRFQWIKVSSSETLTHFTDALEVVARLRFQVAMNSCTVKSLELQIT